MLPIVGWAFLVGMSSYVVQASKVAPSSITHVTYLESVDFSFIIDILIPETLDCVCITRTVGSSIIWWKLER